MKVELLKPHNDGGREYPPGAVIDITDQDAKWLIQIGTAKPATATKPEK